VGRGERFHWRETAGRLARLLEEWDLSVDAGGRWFEARDAEGAPVLCFHPPLVQPLGEPGLDPAHYLEGLRDELGLELLLLLQAGSAALGLWRHDELVAHKVIKKYVVRGRGRAQPAYQKTRGKSRYGSRLRLRNARALLIEVNQRLGEWARAWGPFERVFYSCPVRTWPELLRAKPSPPFSRGDPLVKIPVDVRVPDFEELLRVRRILTHGRVSPAESPPAR
jgi:hypothetical protein